MCFATASQPALEGHDRDLDGKTDNERGALAFLALHVNPSTVVLNDTVADRETKARTAVLLGREERFKYTVSDLLRYTLTGICNTRENIFADHRGLYREETAVGHGMDSIRNDIQKYLLQLVNVTDRYGNIFVFFRYLHLGHTCL